MSTRTVIIALVTALVLAAPASGKSSGIASNAGASSRSAPCPAGAPAQTITIVNGVGAGPGAIGRIERALVGQAVQLRRWWRTPCVTFAPGGWPLRLVRTPTGCEGATGCHCPPVELASVCGNTGEPYATVATSGGPLLGSQVSIAISHELLEMLADPRDDGQEVCDPVEDGMYRLDGVWVSDFVTPAWFDGGRGPFDQARLVNRAHELY